MRAVPDFDRDGAGTMSVQDPVCGRHFDLMIAVANLEHDGWAYFFCSSACCRAFQANPDRYVSGTPKRGRVAERPDV
jgi:YHS domain-containing protein